MNKYICSYYNKPFLFVFSCKMGDWLEIGFSSILAALSFEPLVYMGLIKDRVQKNLSHDKGQSTDAANCYYFAQLLYESVKQFWAEH